MTSDTPRIRLLPQTRPLSAGVAPLVGAAARRLAWIAFCATVVLSPFRMAAVLVSRPQPPLYTSYTDLRLSAAEILLLVTLGLWLVSLVAEPRPVSFGPGFLRWPVVGLLCLVWLGVPFSIDPALSAFDAAQLLLMTALALYALNEIDSISDLARPVALTIGLQSVVALGQFALQRSVGLQGLGEASLDPSRNGISVVAASDTVRLLRAYGLTDHPNILGGLLAFGLLILVFALPWKFDRRTALRALVVALGVAALGATFSRAAWIGGAVGLAVGLAMLVSSRGIDLASVRRRLFALRRRSVLAGTAVALAVLWLVAPLGIFLAIRLGLGGGASVTEEMSIGERSILAGAAIAVAAAHPLLGTGIGTSPLALLRADPGLTFSYQPPHVVLLVVAAEAGIFAALCYLAITVAPWLALVRRPRNWSRDLIAASAALAALTVIGLLDYYTWTFSAGRIWAWLILGLWAGAYARSRTRSLDAV